MRTSGHLIYVRVIISRCKVNSYGIGEYLWLWCGGIAMVFVTGYGIRDWLWCWGNGYGVGETVMV